MRNAKRSSKKKRSKSDATYVIDRLVSNERIIPAQPLYTDTAYWYNEKKLKNFWQEPKGGVPGEFYSPIKGDPVAFANTRPEWYGENISQVWVQEFEFSEGLIVFNSYSYGFADPELGRVTDSRFYRRDVITGNFSFRNGDLRGTATAALRGWSGRGALEGTKWTNNQYEYYFYTENASGVAIDNLGDLADFTSTAWQQSASVQFPEDFSERIQSLSEISQQTDLKRYFPSNWTTTIFDSNLI